MLKPIFLLAAMLFFLKANAQKDYVITVNGDTIHCTITKPILGEFKFKSADMKKTEIIDVDNFKEFYWAEKDLNEGSVFIDSAETARFATILEKGKIYLYKIIWKDGYYTGLPISSTDWYVGKGSNHVISLKNSVLSSTSRQERKDMIGEMFKDNKVVYDKYIADDKFSFKQIRNLIHLYNTGKPYPEPEKEVPKENKPFVFKPHGK